MTKETDAHVSWGPIVAESPMPAKLAVIIFFAVATILNAWQAVDIRLQFVIADVFPDDSYIPEFIAMSKLNACVLC